MTSDLPRSLYCAMTHIDSNIHRRLQVGDIATAAYLSPRAVQYLFRKYLDCTPLEYVNLLRLHKTRRDLITADRRSTSVARVAERWGALSTGRFSAEYRRHFGRNPLADLRATILGGPEGRRSLHPVHGPTCPIDRAQQWGVQTIV